MAANFDRPTGGRGKQGLRRTDAAIRRGAKYAEQLRQLASRIRAAGGEVPGFASAPKPQRAPIAQRPKLEQPDLIGSPDPRTMTREELQAEDVELERARRAAGVTVTPRQRAIRSALGAYVAADMRARAAARRSDAAKRGAVTRARRKAAGLPPKRLEMFMPPPGGWTDADRVS
jgi:hypothetical protein